MPASTLVKDLDAENTSWVLCGPVSFQYHSLTSLPSRVTTRQLESPSCCLSRDIVQYRLVHAGICRGDGLPLGSGKRTAGCRGRGDR